MKKISFATAFFNFASDHKSIVFRIASFANSFTSAFKQKISFNKDFHTRQKIQTPSMETMQSRMSDEISDSTEEMKVNNAKSINNLKILLFTNPARKNLCFSNAITSSLLNLPMFQLILSNQSEKMKQNSSQNEIISELKYLNNRSNISKASTLKLRSIVHSYCEGSRQMTRSFNDNEQHDAGEFLTSVFEHMFQDHTTSNNIDDIMFGGLFQETLVCKCGNVKELPVQKLSEVFTIQLHGLSVQSSMENFLKDEELESECGKCQNQVLVKKFEILAEPSTLIIQLKRYKYEERRTIKKLDEIECSKKISLPSGSTYTISTIVNHIGERPEDGHYNVLIYDNINESFVLLDDLSVFYDVKVTSDLRSLSYIVFYTKDD